MRLSIGLVALLVVACRTHIVDDCRPACEAADVEAFAGCVARGSEACEAGNRRCCALEADCLGMLDDQTVVTSRPSCDVVMEEQCWPPCTTDDEASFDACVVDGSSFCPPGDDVCCALEADCLGTLGDLVVSADGCCSGPEDCPGEVCDPMLWMCMASTPFCGDGTTNGSESCDDGNATTETCDYGVRSCEVCAADCTFQPGETSYCGDGFVDDAHGEACEPPATRVCDAACQRLALPAHCSDGSMTGDETDVDCGGSCNGCGPGEGCRVAGDCRVVTPECNATVVCDAFKGLCGENWDCADGDVCTEDLCEVGVGCDNTTPVDVDRDGHFPLDLGCGDDCDDFRDTVSPSVMFDLGCSSTDVGFMIDDDCDMRVDEDC